MRAISVESMQTIEKNFMSKYSYPSLLLMEQAAYCTLKHFMQHYKFGDRVAIIAGAGNNGGDAYALARLLLSNKINCDIYAFSYPKTEDAIKNRQLVEDIYKYKIKDINLLNPNDYSIIVDGIFGTGFKGNLKKEYIEIFNLINESTAYKIAIDIPSGLNGDTGYVDGTAIKADETITFHRAKKGLLLSQAPEYTGKLYVENIGIYDDSNMGAYLVNAEYAKTMIKAISPIAHKGKLGSLLIVAGSTSYAGAALMNIKSAIKTGVGFITLASNKHTIGLAQENEFLPMGAVIDNDTEKDILLGELEKYSCISIGSGLKASEENEKLVLAIIDIAKAKSIPCVMDAEALNIISKYDIKLAENFLILPHPGEAARLLACSTLDILKDYTLSAENLYKKYDCNIVLKGARSLIYDGKEYAINTSGSPSLAKGGSGDCLCGIVSALIANKSIEFSIFQKANLACYILGRASEISSEKYGEYGSNAITAIEQISSNIADVLVM